MGLDFTNIAQNVILPRQRLMLIPSKICPFQKLLELLTDSKQPDRGQETWALGCHLQSRHCPGPGERQTLGG